MDMKKASLTFDEFKEALQSYSEEHGTYVIKTSNLIAHIIKDAECMLTLPDLRDESMHFVVYVVLQDAIAKLNVEDERYEYLIEMDPIRVGKEVFENKKEAKENLRKNQEILRKKADQIDALLKIL